MVQQEYVVGPAGAAYRFVIGSRTILLCISPREVLALDADWAELFWIVH